MNIKAQTAIPSNVTITRLPPGKVRRELVGRMRAKGDSPSPKYYDQAINADTPRRKRKIVSRTILPYGTIKDDVDEQRKARKGR